MRSRVYWAVLGLVIERPSYAYEITCRFERTYADSLSLSSPSHVYTALGNLRERGFVQNPPGATAAGQSRRHWEATPLGISEHAGWLVSQAQDERRRQHVLITQLGALARTPQQAIAALEAYERACVEEIAALPALGSDEGAGITRLVARLTAEETRLTLTARLRWVQYARSQLQALPGSPPRAVQQGRLSVSSATTGHSSFVALEGPRQPSRGNGVALRRCKDFSATPRPTSAIDNMAQATSSQPTATARSKPRLVRDDRAGTLAAGLAREIEAARVLLADAETARDRTAFDRWQDRFWGWRTRCGAALQAGFQREAAEEFYGGTLIRDYPATQWCEARRAAIKAVEDMIQLMLTLRHTLSGHGGSSNQRDAWRGAKAADHQGLFGVVAAQRSLKSES